MMSRFQTTFQNVEVYYLYAGHILISTILQKIIYHWKRHDEQNSEHFSECRSLLFLRSRDLLILSDVMKNALPLEAS